MTALDRLIAVQPVWTRIAPAADMVELRGRWLLHAGPPYLDDESIPAPVLSSALLAIMHERWAATEGDAEAMIRDGAVRLISAQSHRCVTPLAALVSPSTPVVVVEDARQAVAPVCAPLGATRGPDLRFGTRDRTVLGRLAKRDGEEAPALVAALDEPFDLLALAQTGLGGGDDLHNRTTAATAALAREIDKRVDLAAAEARPALGSLIEALAQTPLYFLTIWMAAAKLILSAAEGAADSTLVTRMAGNGTRFGLSLASDPARWITVPASPPTGDVGAAPLPQGAIGDSAVIDALGFGAQALHLAPEPREALRKFLPQDFEATSARLLGIQHPAFARWGLRVGLDARAVLRTGNVPSVTLGMIGRDGASGLLGRGVYRPPLELFARAIGEINDPAGTSEGSMAASISTRISNDHHSTSRRPT